MFYVTSSTTVGINARPVTVETDISFGMRIFSVVGLPDTIVRESRERIRAAIKNSGFPFPRGRVTVNLAPADIKKQGPVYDLPIALSILIASGEIAPEKMRSCVIVGELSLDGTVRGLDGILPMALMAKQEGKTDLFVPISNVEEALCVKGLNVYGVNHLCEAVDHFKDINLLKPSVEFRQYTNQINSEYDLKDIRGQQLAKRGLEIAAAGGHNILLKGPPGTGKTLLARAIPSLLPQLSEEEALEVTCIASILGVLKSGTGLVRERPFRSVHHSASAISLVGGGQSPKPGEISRAHRGVLFLDELPEFSRHVLEHLRGPLEDGCVTVSRASGSVNYPARFLLVAAMNPCPCGYLDDPQHTCRCSQGTIDRYQKKISGPLLDRFDLVIDVPNITIKDLSAVKHDSETSDTVRERVCRARELQSVRLNGTSRMLNNEILPGDIEKICNMSELSKEVLQKAFVKQRLSARGYFRAQKVARTIADIDTSDRIEPKHIAEALQFRQTLNSQTN